jgi:hypothetical protein
MSQTQPQTKPKFDENGMKVEQAVAAQAAARPRISRMVFVNAISFGGGIESAATDAGLVVVSARGGSGVDIRAAKVLPDGSARALKDGETYDGYLLSKVFIENGKRVQRTCFVDRSNVKEVAFNGD